MTDRQPDAASQADLAPHPDAAPRRGMTVKRTVWALLAFQIALAGILMGRDLWRVLPSIGLPSTQPGFDQPVNPGDQTRRYRPADMPLGPARDGNPDRPFRTTGDMPTRLNFDRQGDTLTLTGSIEPGDFDRFETYLIEDGAGYTAVQLNSPGGAVRDALAIGRRLRDDGANTIMDGNDICLSACPYVLAAGVERDIHEDAQVGVHQHFFEVNTVLPAFLAVEDVQRGQGEVMEYLITMGIDPAVMQHALITPPDEIYVLLPDQLRDFGFTPQPDDDADTDG